MQLACRSFPRWRPGLFAMTVAAAFIAASVSVARADSCDDQAAMLAGHIDGLKVGAARAGVIALEHPLVARASLGCSGRNITNEVFAAAKTSKPPPEFYDFVANAAALIFAIPKPDVLRGAKRCTGRIGFIHGHNIDTRYRRLDIRCSGSKTEQTISISREKDDDS